jgi:small subunit ribosomal protein S6
MSKTKSSEIPHYELLYIISNQFSEDEAKKIADKIKQGIEKRGGIITLSEDWGKKRFAYPIKNFHYGYYELLEFDILGEKLNEIERELRMSNEVLRHQIVSKKVKTAEEIAKQKKISQKIAARAASEEEAEITKEKEKEKDKDKIGLEDLDEKLDKILETDSLL